MQTRHLGIVLVIIGILMMIYTGINFITHENVVDVGPLQINKTENHPVQWSPIIGTILLIAGVVVMVTSKKK